MILRRIILPTLILAAGLGGAVALVKSKPQREPLAREERAWVVAARAVTPGTLSPTLTLYGRVDSPNVSHLRSGLEADVAAVEAREGDRVAAGQRLVRLDDRDARLALTQRRAEAADIEAQIRSETLRHEADLTLVSRDERLLALARDEVARLEPLVRSRMASQTQLDVARQQVERAARDLEVRRLSVREHDARQAQLAARLNRARALVEAAELDLARTEIVAPFEGRVTEVAVAPGNRVRPGDPALTLYDLGAVEIRAQVPLQHLPAVRPRSEDGSETRAEALVDGVRVGAVLDRLSGEVAAGAAGADAIFEIRDGAEAVQLGRVVELLVTLPPQDDVVALPFEALYGRDRVFRVVGERMEPVSVERVGERRAAGGGAEVLVRGAELAAGDRVVVTQIPSASAGLRVRVARTD
ncbi:MAG: efflux RND transporter periplasmic adaptor subunit [Chromatiales bacterium]|nr:efflux RND transporter periplasmic adaptor subunit [Chromatiales bacterium]